MVITLAVEGGMSYWGGPEKVATSTAFSLDRSQGEIPHFLPMATWIKNLNTKKIFGSIIKERKLWKTNKQKSWKKIL